MKNTEFLHTSVLFFGVAMIISSIASNAIGAAWGLDLAQMGAVMVLFFGVIFGLFAFLRAPASFLAPSPAQQATARTTIKIAWGLVQIETVTAAAA